MSDQHRVLWMRARAFAESSVLLTASATIEWGCTCGAEESNTSLSKACEFAVLHGCEQDQALEVSSRCAGEIIGEPFEWSP